MIAFGPATDLHPLVDDAEFFRQIDWDPAAKSLRHSAQSGNWQRTTHLLATHAAGVRPSWSAPRGEDRKLALWSLHNLECPQRSSRLVAAWQAFRPTRRRSLRTASLRTNGRKPKIDPAHKRMDGSLQDLSTATAEWLASTAEIGPILPLELLILGELLRDAAIQFPVDLAARLWRVTLASSLGQLNGTVSNPSDTEAVIDPDRNLGQISLDAEFAWQAGLLFAPVAGSASLREAGRAGLWTLLANSSDSSGVPAARALRDLPVWMTSVVRAREWGRIFGRPLFDGSQEKRLRGIVNSIAKLCREDGRPALTGCEANSLFRVWSTAVAAYPIRLRESSPAARYLLSLGPGKTTGRARDNTAARNGSRNRVPRDKARYPVFQSDESCLACLRSDWSATANSVLVSHQGRFPTLELALGGMTLFSGDWEIELRLDGRPVEPAEWKCVCWHSDDDGDYLELQTRPAGLCVERQIYLSRTDDFALLADAVRGHGNSKIESTSRLALSSDCAALAQTRTRECRVLLDGGGARVFPLALNCPRVEGTAGRLSTVEGRVELNQSGITGLYAPLILDWNPRRRRSPAAWKRLTVALGGAAVPPGDAAGFLLEIGPSKWLIYRSLCRALEPRSVLGQHTMYETTVGRFVRGDLEPMVQVEQASEKGE